MADEAIKTGDYPPIPTEFDEENARFTSQANNIIGTPNQMDRTIHKFMPDRSVYVKFKLDEVEAKFASLRERIVKQETLDPREIKRLALRGEYVAPVYELAFVDTEKGMQEMLRTMVTSIIIDTNSLHPNEPSLSVDTEGGISLLQILVHNAKKVYIIDFTKLGGLVFTASIPTEQGEPTTLKTIFESSHVLKLLWDARGDSAMFHKFHNVTLRCILDVQLMDLATRRGYKGKGRSKKKLLHDLKTVKAMGQAFHERCTEIPLEVRREWSAIKDFGKMAMTEGYALTQRLYDASGGDIAVAHRILGEERMALALSGSSGSESESESGSSGSAHDSPVQQAQQDTAVWAFDIRPLPPLLTQYASNDVTALPVMYLHHVKHATWNAEVEKHVWEHSEKRLQMAREPGSDEKLRGNEKLAPEGWFEAEWLEGVTAK